MARSVALFRSVSAMGSLLEGDLGISVWRPNARSVGESKRKVNPSLQDRGIVDSASAPLLYFAEPNGTTLSRQGSDYNMEGPT